MGVRAVGSQFEGLPLKEVLVLPFAFCSVNTHAEFSLRLYENLGSNTAISIGSVHGQHHRVLFFVTIYNDEATQLMIRWRYNEVSAWQWNICPIDPTTDTIKEGGKKRGQSTLTCMRDLLVYLLPLRQCQSRTSKHTPTPSLVASIRTTGKPMSNLTPSS